jgi:hypothetical protein
MPSLHQQSRLSVSAGRLFTAAHSFASSRERSGCVLAPVVEGRPVHELWVTEGEWEIKPYSIGVLYTNTLHLAKSCRGRVAGDEAMNESGGKTRLNSLC